MLIYGLLLYVCKSRQDSKGVSTFTIVGIIDWLCRLFLWGVPLLSTTNHYQLLFRGLTPVLFSHAKTLVASLHFSSNPPQLTLCTLKDTQLIQISDLPPMKPACTPQKRLLLIPSLFLSFKYGVLTRTVWLWRHKLTCVDPSIKKLVSLDKLNLQSRSMLKNFETVGAFELSS